MWKVAFLSWFMVKCLYAEFKALQFQVISQEESTRAQDMWSCGIITYILLCGYPPFFKDSEEKSETGLLRQIVRGKFKFHENFWDHISDEAKHFVSRLMCPNPRLRITVDEALNHPWIVKCNKANYKESAAYILLQSFTVFVIICAIFSIYFAILSGYFDIEYHFISRAWQAVCSVHLHTRTLASKSSEQLSSLFGYLSSLAPKSLSEILQSDFGGIENELWWIVIGNFFPTWTILFICIWIKIVRLWPHVVSVSNVGIPTPAAVMCS